MAVTDTALLLAILQITVLGQRVSLRRSVPLTDDFFKKQKEEWRNNLQGFPNLDEILRSLDDGQYIAGLFEKGSFNLAVLWSCSTIEKIIDSTADGIISITPEKTSLFRKQNGLPQHYPSQLKILGYSLKIEKQDNSEQMNIFTLWELRNKIAHDNYKPTFSETYCALTILVSVVHEFPKTLQSWKSKGH